MSKYSLILSPDCWEDVIPMEFLDAFFPSAPVIFAYFRSVNTPSNKYGDVLRCRDILSEMRLMMSAKDRVKHDAKHGDVKLPGKSDGGNGVHWCNITFTDEDVLELERLDSSLEYLATRVCSILEPRIKFSLSHRDEGKSVCATFIFTEVLGNGSRSYGLSGFGSNVRDALLCLVYKHDICLAGDFSLAHKLYSTERERPRFG